MTAHIMKGRNSLACGEVPSSDERFFSTENISKFTELDKKGDACKKCKSLIENQKSKEK